MLHIPNLKLKRNFIKSFGDIALRIEQHNKGFVKSTKSYRPWKLVYFEEFDNLGYARRREKQIKSWKSRAAIERLLPL